MRVTLEGGKTIEAELLLVAVGRGPVSEDLGYEQVGVEMERGFVKVDALLPDQRPRRSTRSATSSRPCSSRTSASPRASSSPSALAGLTRHAGRLRRRAARHLLRPRGRLGRHHVEAGEGARATTSIEATYDLAGNGKAQILGTAGAVKVVAAKDGPVLGVHMVGDARRRAHRRGAAHHQLGGAARPRSRSSSTRTRRMSEAVGEAHLALAGKPLHSPLG